jgi:hypothetical protein
MGGRGLPGVEDRTGSSTPQAHDLLGHEPGGGIEAITIRQGAQSAAPPAATVGLVECDVEKLRQRAASHETPGSGVMNRSGHVEAGRPVCRRRDNTVMFGLRVKRASAELSGQHCVVGYGALRYHRPAPSCRTMRKNGDQRPPQVPALCAATTSPRNGQSRGDPHCARPTPRAWQVAATAHEAAEAPESRRRTTPRRG